MAKSKKGTKSLVLAIICFLFGALLFSSMFMPMIAAKDFDAKVSAVNVVTAMGFDETDALRANSGEQAAYGIVRAEETASKIKAAGILNLIASIFGGLLAIVAVLSLLFKSGLLKKLMLMFGALGMLCAIGSLVAVIIFLATKIDYGFYVIKASDLYGIHAASIIAIISGFVSATCAGLNKKN